MANKKFSSKIVQRWDVNFATTGLAAAGVMILDGAIPTNALITNGWAVIKTSLGDVDDDSTTLAIGYTDVTAGFYPATAISGLDAGVYLKLIPGVLNIGTAEAITTVDTPAEVVALARVSGNTHSGITSAHEHHVILTASNDHNIDAGIITIFLEYLLF
jgi:hypothetical protein